MSALGLMGVILFAGLHLIPVFLPQLRQRMAGAIGEMPYKGLFALLVLGALLAIIFGWGKQAPTQVYMPPAWGIHVTPLFMVVAFILFFASRLPTNLRRLIRHPQLTAVVLWGVGHLLANGDSRSVILFGVLGVWAVVTMFGLNRRDGARPAPEPVPHFRDGVLVVVGLTVFAVFAQAHLWLFGVTPFPA
ncbi:NnrU family protein [Yunchengibacter salinarum]|uniref:NnrU family protein n=1 Tax=Yunchengibacter salinarum TaxID=3133399 RepID=UPI0035B60E43